MVEGSSRVSRDKPTMSTEAFLISSVPLSFSAKQIFSRNSLFPRYINVIYLLLYSRVECNLIISALLTIIAFHAYVCVCDLFISIPIPQHIRYVTRHVVHLRTIYHYF